MPERIQRYGLNRATETVGMNRDDRGAQARRRAVPALFGLIAFASLGFLANADFGTEWWFYVALGVAISVTLIEPFFTRPQVSGRQHQSPRHASTAVVKRDTVITLPVAFWNVNAVPTGPQKTGSCNELGVGVADTDLADTCSAGAWSEALHAPRVSPPPKARSQSGHRG